ncbi:MAG: aromatic amino acid hydroxylase [Bacteroidia bacterium]|nr:aromatic amino acid hydroxylase [Bacteroidia bacterium]
MEMNEILDRLPKHLLSLVIDQPYNSYTSQDHALWRYVMRQNVRYLGKVAHGSYLDGLKRTGISIDEIPHMYGMNRILREIGWAAVAVDGFIPPSAFMEFQAYRVLVIAADIRPMDQIGYTPAPDIIHEAAGHAPIIADPVYADYLQRFGEVGSKAFMSANDFRVYNAIRHLSILKADPYSDPQKVKQASNNLEELASIADEPSELARIRNLHWWTVEYGLIGDPENIKIYGAGLLSSIAESYYCLQPKVKKLPYSLDAVNYSFDITEPQPQLFVTPDFETLTRVLDEFASTMAFRTGGADAVKKAIRSGYTATCVLGSGVQISGTFTRLAEKNGEVVYLGTAGPTNLCYNNTEIPGQGCNNHRHGFGSPVGRWKGLSILPEEASDETLAQLGIKIGEPAMIDFESGVSVKGVCRSFTRRDGHLLIISFSDCNVIYDGQTLFEPSWGIYDMAVGSVVSSAYPGPADPVAFGFSFPVPQEKTHKIHHSAEALDLHRIYADVREIREQKQIKENIHELWKSLKLNHPEDWLCALEILEIINHDQSFADLNTEIIQFLDETKEHHPDQVKLIDDGLRLIFD